MGLPVRQLYTLTLTAEPYCWNICRLYYDAIKIRTVCSEKHSVGMLLQNLFMLFSIKS